MLRGFGVVLIAMLVAAGCQPAVDVPGGGPVDDWPVYGTTRAARVIRH